MQEASRSRADNIRALDRFHAAPIFAHVVQDTDITAAIVNFCGAHNIDIIALASRGRALSRMIVGSVADPTLRTSGLPILTLHTTTLDLPPLRLEAEGEDDLVPHRLPAFTVSYSSAPLRFLTEHSMNAASRTAN